MNLNTTICDRNECSTEINVSPVGEADDHYRVAVRGDADRLSRSGMDDVYCSRRCLARAQQEAEEIDRVAVTDADDAPDAAEEVSG